MERPLRVGFVLHVMDVAGAEVLVYEIIQRLGPSIQPVVFCLDSVGALGRRLQAAGTPVIGLDRQPGIDLRVARRLAAETRQRKIQVLHAHQYTSYFYAAIARAVYGARPRIVFTEHGRHYPDVVSARRRQINRLWLRRVAHAVTAVSRFSADSLAERDGFRGTNIEVIPNGVALDRLPRHRERTPILRELGLDPARRYIACAARFHPVKDHDMLLKAFACVARRQDDVDLLLAGNGPLRSEIETHVRQAGLTARVHLLGVRSDVPEIFHAAEVVALTSKSEAASLTMLEAMACRRPLVVTHVGGNPELVRHEREGLLVPRGDAAACAAALDRLLENPGLCARLGQAGCDRVRARFHIRDTTRRYGALYRRLDAQHVRSAA